MMHRPHVPRLATTALLGLTLLAGHAEAKKPQPAPPPAASVLTADEVACQGLGQITETLTQYRDKGVPYLTVVTILRETPARNAYDAWLTQASLHMLPVIYDTMLLTPRQVRQRTEIGCLKGPETTPTTSTDLRY